MRCPESCSSLPSVTLATLLLTLALSRASPERQKIGSHEVDNLNKTLIAKVNTEKFLEKILSTLKKSNGSQPAFNHTFSPPTTRENSPGHSILNKSTAIIREQKVPVPVFTPGELIIREQKVPAFNPELIYSETTGNFSGKNVLTFRFRPEIIKGGKPVLRINLFLYVSKKDNKESGTESFPSTFPTSRNLGNVKTNSREKGKKIKILIFLVTASGNRIQKLAELKKSINRSQWEKLGLPVSLISKVAEANSNNTLYLRVECKKCNKKTQLSIPTKCIRRHRLRKNKKDKREPRSNKNCSHSSAATADVHKPFIVVESSDAISRNKRNAKPEPACEDVGVNKTGITTPGCCKQIKTFVQFADLNLSNAIVSPTGFYLVTCTGECTTASPVKTRSQYRRSEDINLNVRSSLAKGYHRILRHLYHRHRYSPGHPLPRHPHHQSRSWYNEKWTRSLSPSANTCEPVQTEELILLHFTQDQTLVRSHIPNFLVTKCGCKGDRSTNSK